MDGMRWAGIVSNVLMAFHVVMARPRHWSVGNWSGMEWNGIDRLSFCCSLDVLAGCYWYGFVTVQCMV